MILLLKASAVAFVIVACAAAAIASWFNGAIKPRTPRCVAFKTKRGR